MGQFTTHETNQMQLLHGDDVIADLQMIRFTETDGRLVLLDSQSTVELNNDLYNIVIIGSQSGKKTLKNISFDVTELKGDIQIPFKIGD